VCLYLCLSVAHLLSSSHPDTVTSCCRHCVFPWVVLEVPFMMQPIFFLRLISIKMYPFMFNISSATSLSYHFMVLVMCSKLTLQKQSITLRKNEERSLNTPLRVPVIVMLGYRVILFFLSVSAKHVLYLISSSSLSLSDFSQPISFENAEIGQCPNLAPPPPFLPEDEEPEKPVSPLSPLPAAVSPPPGPPAVSG